MSITEYFRAMTPTEHGLPSVGPGKRKLGSGAHCDPTKDGVFGIGNEPLYVVALDARRDPSNAATPAFVEPFTTMTHSEYTTALAHTQTAWRRLWPKDLA